MRILHNLASLDAYNAYSKNLVDENRSMSKISSGYAVSKASDNPNAISQSEKMRVQIAGLNIAARNVQDGVSMMQNLDGGLDGITSMIQRIKELTVQGLNGTNDSDSVEAVNMEISQTSKGIDDMANNTEFNGLKLLVNSDVTDNNNPKTMSMPVGANTGESINIPMYNLVGVGTQFHPLLADGTVDNSKYFKINFSQINLRAADVKSTDGKFTVSGLNMQNIEVYNSDGSFSGNISAQDAADAIQKNDQSGQKTFSPLQLADNALDTVLSIRDKYGAISNRFESSYDNLNAISDKIQGAESSIRDVDIAKEMGNFSKSNILVQAGIAILAQTNRFPQDILKILENVR